MNDSKSSEKPASQTSTPTPAPAKAATPQNTAQQVKVKANPKISGPSKSIAFGEQVEAVSGRPLNEDQD